MSVWGHTLPVHVAMHIAELAGQHFGSTVKLSPIKVNDQETVGSILPNVAIRFPAMRSVPYWSKTRV